MFDKPYETRLSLWQHFRKNLDASDDPLQLVIDFYQSAPTVTINCDPWDKNSWPDPWELLAENQYCEYCIILGMCYTLQLTDKFSQEQFEIHIVVDKENSDRMYLLYVGDTVLGYYYNTYIHRNELPSGLHSEVVYQMSGLA